MAKEKNLKKDKNKQSLNKKEKQGNGFIYKKQEISDTEIHFDIKIDSERFKKEDEKVYEKQAKDIKVPGFRPGKAPKKIIKAKLGIEKTINSLIPAVTREIIEKEDFFSLDYVRYEIKKVEKDLSINYKAKFIILPEKSLPDFSKINIEKAEIEIEAKEIDRVFNQLKDEIIKNKQTQDSSKSSNKTSKSKKKEVKEEKKIEKTQKSNKTDKNQENQEKQVKEDKKDLVKNKEVKINWEKDLKIQGVKTEKDVKDLIINNIKLQKNREINKQRVEELIEEAIKLFDIEIAPELIKKQVDSMEKAYKKRIENYGLKFEDYLKAQKMSLEDLQKDWKKQAIRDISLDILYMKIIQKYNLKVKESEIDAQINSIPNKQEKKKFQTSQGREKISTIVMQQKALTKLIELANFDFMGDEKKNKKNKKKEKKEKLSSSQNK